MVRIDHLAIWTRDLERLCAFYQSYFHAQVGSKYFNPSKQFESYFLTFEDGTRLELMRLPDLASPSCEPPWVGYAHIALSLGSKEAVDALTARLEQDGYVKRDGPRTTGDGYYESVFLDPDDNYLELTI